MSHTRNDGEDSIHRLYAWTAYDQHGIEGIVTAQGINGMPVPLLSTSREEALSLGTSARRISEATGRPVRLVQFERTLLMLISEPSRRS
jgi:hypothetical protein